MQQVAHHHAVHAVPQLHREGYPALNRRLLEHRAHIPDQEPHVERLALKLHLAGFDTAHVQYVVDERQQEPTQLVGVIKVAQQLVRTVAMGARQLQHAQDAVERRSYLVAHPVEEIGLDLGIRRKAFKLLAQLGHALPLVGHVVERRQEVGVFQNGHDRAAQGPLRGKAVGRAGEVERERLPLVPILYRPPDRAARVLVHQAVQGLYVILDALARQSEQAREVPADVNRVQVLPAHEQAHGRSRLEERFLEQLVAAVRTVLFARAEHRVPSASAGLLLHIQVDGVRVQAREQRVADLHRVAGGQLAPGRGGLDVVHRCDVAERQAAEDLGRRVRHERRHVQRDDADGLERVVDAVSYTHLDVYKRQPEKQPPSSLRTP